ncbi:MAG: hypothetical protein WC657_09480, partial [Candidatus Paceibacterota bacterium]
ARAGLQFSSNFPKFSFIPHAILRFTGHLHACRIGIPGAENPRRRFGSALRSLVSILINPWPQKTHRAVASVSDALLRVPLSTLPANTPGTGVATVPDDRD